MRRHSILFAIVGTLALGCGGGDGDDDDDVQIDGGPGQPDAAEELANDGFRTPSVTTTAWELVDGVWEELGPANWECLGTPSGDPVPNATITAFASTDFSGNGIATATSSDPNAEYSMTLPVGQTRVAFRVVEPENALDTYLLNQYFDPDTAARSFNQSSVSLLTANALPAFIGITRTQGSGVLAAAIRDCDGNEVSGAIATVSSTEGSPDHLEGASTYYFSAGSTSLPVRVNDQPVTNKDGLFVVLELPPANTAYLQVWGFTDAQDPATDELTLLGEMPAPVLPDSVITASMEPLRD